MCVCSLILCFLVLFLSQVTSDPIFLSHDVLIFNISYLPPPRGLPRPLLPPMTKHYQIINNASQIYRVVPTEPPLPPMNTNHSVPSPESLQTSTFPMIIGNKTTSRNNTSPQTCDWTIPSNITRYNVTSNNATMFQSYNSHCGCKKNCLRKCCRPEFVLKRIKGQLMCYKLKKSAFTVSFYNHNTYIEKRNVTTYVNGVMNCTVLIKRNVVSGMYPQMDQKVVYDAFHPKRYWDSNDLCIENFYKGQNRKTLVVLMCDDKDPVIIIGGTVSSIFILATFLVLILQPQKNMYTKILLVHTCNIAMSFISLTFAHMNGNNGSTDCLLSAYLSLFFSMSSLCCINIICIDIYLSFRGSFGFPKHNHVNKERIIFYFLYGIFTPLFYIVILILFEQFKSRLTYIYPPHVGRFSCFLEKGNPYLIYFHAPMGFVHGINIVLFNLTVISISKQKKKCKILESAESRQFKDEIHSSILYLKLGMCMGLNWFIVFVMEILPLAFYNHHYDTPFWLGNPPYAAYVNMTNGILIFFMVAWKKKYWNNIKQRYIIYKNQDGASNDSTQLTSTNSAQLSDLSLHM